MHLRYFIAVFLILYEVDQDLSTQFTVLSFNFRE